MWRSSSSSGLVQQRRKGCENESWLLSFFSFAPDEKKKSPHNRNAILSSQFFSREKRQGETWQRKENKCGSGLHKKSCQGDAMTTNGETLHKMTTTSHYPRIAVLNNKRARSPRISNPLSFPLRLDYTLLLHHQSSESTIRSFLHFTRGCSQDNRKVFSTYFLRPLYWLQKWWGKEREREESTVLINKHISVAVSMTSENWDELVSREFLFFCLKK